MGRVIATIVAACAVVLAVLSTAAGTADAAGWWHPPQQLTWYWQLTGTLHTEPVQVVDTDGFNATAATVASLHARGQRAICYIDVGTSEDWRPDAGRFPASVLGSSNGWPGERWLDIRQLGVLEPIMAARLLMCQQKGFDAVEPDNMDGYTNSTGFPLQASDQLAYDEWIAQQAHLLGMAVLQKNDPEQATPLAPFFDGVLDEQCNEDRGCSAYAPYVKAGKPVLNAEYQSSLFPGFCTSDAALGIMGALYSTALDGSVYRPCFGPSAQGPPIVALTPSSSPPPSSSPSGGSPTGTSGSRPGTGRRHATALDRRAPRVRIAGAGKVKVRRHRLALTLVCPARQSICTGHLTLRTVRRFHRPHHRAARVVLARRAFVIAGAHRRRLTIRLVARAVRRLRSRSRVKVVATIVARNGAHRRATTRRRLELALRRP